MSVLHVRPERWVDELNALTRIYGGWSVSLAVFGDDGGAAPEIVNLPLIGVSADRLVHDGTIAVSVARSARGHLTHVIEGVKALCIERVEDGTSARLLVYSEGGVTTVLEFRATATPAA